MLKIVQFINLNKLNYNIIKLLMLHLINFKNTNIFIIQKIDIKII